MNPLWQHLQYQKPPPQEEGRGNGSRVRHRVSFANWCWGRPMVDEASELGGYNYYDWQQKDEVVADDEEELLRKGEEEVLGRGFACHRTLEGHHGDVLCLALSEDGCLLYSGSNGERIRVWHSQDLLEAAQLPRVSGAVHAILAVGDVIYTAHQNQDIMVWRRSHSTNGRLRYHQVAVLPTWQELLLTWPMGPSVVTESCRFRHVWYRHIDVVSALAVGEGVLYSASWDRTFKVWRLGDLRCLESVEAHSDALTAIAVAGRIVFTASSDGTIKVWRRGRTKHHWLLTLHEHKGGVNALVLSPGGDLLYSGGCDGKIRVWAANRPWRREDSREYCLEVLGGQTLAVLSLAVAGRFVFSGSTDRQIRVWLRKQGHVNALVPAGAGASKVPTWTSHTCVSILTGHKGPVRALLAATDGCQIVLYSGSLDHAIKVWRAQEGSLSQLGASSSSSEN